MKSIFLFIFLSLSAFSLSGAKQTMFRWKSIDPVFDSVVNKLEREFIASDNFLRKDTLTDCLYALAGEHAEEQVFYWRACFWEARLRLKKNDRDSALVLIDRAYQLVDSAAYSYDYMRILHLKMVVNQEKAHLAYENLKGVSEYYSETNDLFMLAHVCIDLGNILSGLKDYSQSLVFLQRADSCYRVLNEEVYRAKNRLNIANTLYLQQEAEQADRILYDLLENPVCVGDTVFHVNTLLSLAEHGGYSNKSQLTEAYRLSQACNNRTLLIYSECFLGHFYQNRLQPEQALYYYKKAYRRLGGRRADLQAPLLKGMADCFYELQCLDSAYVYLDRYTVCKDSLNAVNSLAEIRRIESRAVLEKQELEFQQDKERSHFRFVLACVVCALIVCMSFFVCYVFWRRYREEKMKKQLEELENRELAARLENEILQKDYFKLEAESKDRELMSNSLIILEKNQVLKSLLEEIEQEAESGNALSGPVVRISSKIKRHLGTDSEWEFFQMQFGKVHPDFSSKLKEHCSGLTEGELRFCAYIRIGMENKQIAQMLSLQPDSIKKTRYRIRKKLAIETDGSLEDFLRNI